MTAEEAKDLVRKICARNGYMSKESDPGGNFGGTNCCEYGCNDVIEAALIKEFEAHDVD